MEAIYALGAAIASAWTAYLLLGGAGGDDLGVLSRGLRRCGRRAGAVFSALAGSRLVEALLRLDGWRSCSRWASSAAAGSGLELDERGGCAAILCLGTAGSFALSALFATWLCLPLGACCLAVGVPALAARRREALRREQAAAMPAVFRTLAVAMSSGMTLVQSAEYAGAHVGGAPGEALARLGLRLRCGTGTEEALTALAGELPAPGVGLLATALVISHRTGSPLKGLFQRSAVLVERQGEFERLLSVKTAQVRLSVRIVCLLPAVMVTILATISPDFQKGLATASGVMCVCAAAVLDGLAVLIIRRLAKGVL